MKFYILFHKDFLLFSFFISGKALMDDNVMAKYTTKSSQARHYVQYDQGE